jgi:hypothetical protein
MDNLDKEFIPYKQALVLKELGFDEPCLAFSYVKSEFGYIAHKVYLIDYLDDDSIVKNSEKEYYYVRPTYSQAFRFFRKKYNCYHTITLNKKYVGIVYSSVVNFSIDEFDTYEEAELECIKKLIEIVKNKEVYEFGNNPVRG